MFQYNSRKTRFDVIPSLSDKNYKFAYVAEAQMEDSIEINHNGKPLFK